MPLIFRQPIYWSLAEEFLGDTTQEPAPPLMQVQKSTVAESSKKRAGNR
jgi:hypothetical protein